MQKRHLIPAILLATFAAAPVFATEAEQPKDTTTTETKTEQPADTGSEAGK